MGIDHETARLCVGPGWGPLIDEVYDRLPSDTIVIQVKEKFGGLRIYVDAAPEEFLNFLDEIEDKSWTVCETCGKPGEIRMKGWIKVRCDECERCHS